MVDGILRQAVQLRSAGGAGGIDAPRTKILIGPGMNVGVGFLVAMPGRRMRGHADAGAADLVHQIDAAPMRMRVLEDPSRPGEDMIRDHRQLIGAGAVFRIEYVYLAGLHKAARGAVACHVLLPHFRIDPLPGQAQGPAAVQRPTRPRLRLFQGRAAQGDRLAHAPHGIGHGRRGILLIAVDRHRLAVLAAGQHLLAGAARRGLRQTAEGLQVRALIGALILHVAGVILDLRQSKLLAQAGRIQGLQFLLPGGAGQRSACKSP